MSHSNADEPSANVELIREAFHYQSRFHNSTVVFKIDFPVTEHPLFPSIVKDLALLANTGFRVVIVPGAKEWISEILAQYAIPSSYKGSRRITTAQAMPFVQMAAFHSATAFMTGFSASRVDAVTGNFVRARGIGVIDGTDMEHTGAVDKIYTESLQRILELGMVPLLPCIGWSSSGKPYNVPSSEIAFSAATRLGAVKLVLVSLSEGIKKDSYDIPDDIATTECGRITRLTPQQAQQVLDANARKGADDKALADLALAVRACKAGVERVHIINGDEEGAILKELFSNLGSGTMVYADEYESIRGIKSRDVPDILRLMEPLMQQGILVRRAAEDILSKKEDFAAFYIDGQIRACGALHTWDGDQCEIAAIATDPAYAQMGLGSSIVRYLIGKAKRQGCKRVFALTTRTQDWFESLGFRETAQQTLPEKKRRLYDCNRNSKVFALELE